MANTITGGAAASSSLNTSTTLETAREILDLGSRMPGSETSAGTNNLKRVDWAIKAACDEYVRMTKCTRTTNDSLTLTADSEDFSTSSVTNFDPSRIIKIEVEHPTSGQKYAARQASYDTVRTWRLHGIERYEWYPYTNNADFVGTPEVFGWRDNANAIVAPLPQIAWKVLLTYWEAATSWTIGTASPADVTLNIPDDVIIPVIQHGAAFYLNKSVHPASASMDRQLFDKHIVETRGFYSVTKSITAQREDYI